MEGTNKTTKNHVQEEAVETFASLKAYIVRLEKEKGWLEEENISLKKENASLKARVTELEEERAPTPVATTMDTPEIESIPTAAESIVEEAAIDTGSTVKQTQNLKRKRSSIREGKRPAQGKTSNVWPKDINQLLKEKYKYEDLPTFTTGKASINENDLNCIVDVFMILKKAYRFRGLNESGRSVFIALVLALVVVNTTSGAIVEPQYRFRKGQSGQIVPDWVIKQGDKILLVVEAKSHTFSGDITQHIEQLYAAYKETCSSESGGWKTVHGLITTADKWLFVKASFSSEKCKIMRSHIGHQELPLNSESVDKNQLENKLELLARQLVWFSSDKHQ
jgi:hypothetical protein